ncbi:thioesterase [Kocuria varians]|uniref:Thioesterase n=1 Tax=Kocuria varians TaxID=1272 RepID=A0A4Y4D4P1_KOCVA|nr:alpha/beta fold hydrolase [Kocuria varians]GEC98664.1 thioesterase [Kocuria varians]
MATTPPPDATPQPDPARQPVPPATAVHRWSAAGPAPRRRLVLFPHAGGGGLTGRSLQLPGTEILVHRRPGRESRMAETATVTAQDAVAEALAALLPVLDADEIPTTVLGHSFGALIAAGFAAAVDRLRPGRLECVVLSAKAAPPAPDPELAAILEDDDALAAWVLALGGTPEELLADPGLREMVLAPLRSDLRASLSHDAPPPRFTTPLLLVHAREDPGATAESMTGWAAATSGPVRRLEVPGGHHGLYGQAELLRAGIDETVGGVR